MDGLAGGMENAANALPLLAELVEAGNGRIRFFNMIFDASFLEQFFGVGMGLENEIHAPREDHDLNALLQDFFNVGRLGARSVAGSGFAPVPFSGPTGPYFAIFEGLGSAVDGDFHSPPGDVGYCY